MFYCRNNDTCNHAVTPFQSTPTILCLTATLIEVAQKRTLTLLGMSDHVHKIQVSPISPRVSFKNSGGTLNIEYIGSMVQAYKKECPRILIFEDTLVACGAQYLDVEHVSFSLLSQYAVR